MAARFGYSHEEPLAVSVRETVGLKTHAVPHAVGAWAGLRRRPCIVGLAHQHIGYTVGGVATAKYDLCVIVKNCQTPLIGIHMLWQRAHEEDNGVILI
jgi:hypothetical protein